MLDISLIPKEKIRAILPLIKLLNPDLPETVLLERLDEMLERGYECVGIYDNDKLVGISGLWTLTKLYVGKHIEPDNVVILPEYRNREAGKQLMSWIDGYAKSKGCLALELNCYLGNKKGQAFWEREGYRALGLHYQKKL